MSPSFIVAGVSVMKGQEEVHVHAPMVISNAGIFNTYQTLLPKELQAMPGTMKLHVHIWDNGRLLKLFSVKLFVSQKFSSNSVWWRTVKVAWVCLWVWMGPRRSWASKQTTTGSLLKTTWMNCMLWWIVVVKSISMCHSFVLVLLSSSKDLLIVNVISTTGRQSTYTEIGKSPPGRYLFCLLPLLQPKIQPGQKDHQVYEHGYVWSSTAALQKKIIKSLVSSCFIEQYDRCIDFMNMYLVRKVHFELGQLCQLQVVWGVEGWQSDKQRSRVQRAKAGFHRLCSGHRLGCLP